MGEGRRLARDPSCRVTASSPVLLQGIAITDDPDGVDSLLLNSAINRRRIDRALHPNAEITV